MRKNRGLIFLIPVLLGLVGLLAWARGRDAEPHRAVPAPATAPAVSVADDAAPAPATVTPRHPEIGFRGEDRLDEHFRKHGREFHARSAAEYLRLAQHLRDQPRGPTVLEFVRNDAVTCKFDRESGAFIAYNSDGTIRTFFRPNDGEAYFERQKSRAHESP